MSNQVVVLYFNEDGDVPSVNQMSKEEFLSRLEENYWGENPKFADMKPGWTIDTDSFVGLVVIEGKVIVPKPVQVATKYEI